MARSATFTKHFGEGAKLEIGLQEDDKGQLSTYFCVRKRKGYVMFPLEDLAGMHNAIHELECVMPSLEATIRAAAEALTDGASVESDAAEPEGVIWSPGVIGTLANLTHGHLLSEGNALFGLLLVNNLIKKKRGPGDWYTISDKGRAALEAADAEAPEADDADSEAVPTQSERKMLHALENHHIHIYRGHPLFEAPWCNGWIELAQQPTRVASILRAYTISDKGRATLRVPMALQ